MDGFPFVHRETVRFRDLDSLGHVNNAVYVTYVEQGRIAFLHSRGASPESVIVGRVEIDFRSPLRLGEEVAIGVRLARLGTTSFDFEYELRADDRLVAQARDVNVVYDYDRRQPTQIPDEWKARLAA
ncbi:MAG: acyl-CoA thioesterase [Actinomycetota bacterium]|nr:acyl-CoA thioesterase [Actinomycetota bacterium]